MTLAIFGSIGPVEIIVILLIAIVIFGRDLPDVGKRLGKTLFQVRRGINEIKGDFYDTTADIREEVRGTENDLNRMLNEPAKPSVDNDKSDTPADENADELEDRDNKELPDIVEETGSDPAEESENTSEPTSESDENSDPEDSVTDVESPESSENSSSDKPLS